MRLDKYIANTTDLSRKDVKTAIKNGWVEVDDELASNPGMKVPEDASVSINGEHLKAPAPRYFMLNKPQGAVCATKDSNNMTVLEFFDEEPNADKLHIAGRLDIDTTGLVLITDDGKWTHQVISPNAECPKRYYVETLKSIEPETIKALEKGVMLQGETKRCRPAQLDLIDTDRCLLTIHEGKYHQVKRMFASQGNEVIKLHRESVGNIVLDEDLMEGEYRELSETEAFSIFKDKS